jgi:hypothetical protein
MKKKLASFSLLCGIATLIGLMIPSAAFAGFAGIGDWVGIDNMAGANNYDVITRTSAGGTFADRRLNAASLSDHTLEGGSFDWNSPLSMSGQVSYSSSVFDPVMFFGWYNSSNLNQRIGLGVANPVPAGSGIRWQTQSGNTGATGVVSQNLGANTTVSTFPPGTYSFTFNYDGDGHMTGTFGSLNFARNYAVPTNQDLNMDRFGFLQKATADDDSHTYTLRIHELNYTGETQIPEPASVLLLALGSMFAAGARRRWQ